MGTYYSSFSDAIQRLRLARGTASVDDCHELTPPAWDLVKAGGTRDVSVALDHPALVAMLRLLGQHCSQHGAGVEAAHRAWVAEGWGTEQQVSTTQWVPTGALCGDSCGRDC
jgi:hypothetical protein